MSWPPNPKHWFERANETRLIGSGIVDPVVRAIICKMADEYDRLAALAIKRLENQEETERRQQEHAAMRKAARFATSTPPRDPGRYRAVAPQKAVTHLLRRGGPDRLAG